MIKVLHLVSSLSVGSGLMSVIMNYYRYIDRTQVQFGFVYFKDIKEKTYESEIKELGGECFLIERPTIAPWYVHYVNEFMKNHRGYSILHLHELYLGFIFARSAKKYGKMKVVGHAHTTKYAETTISAARNKLLCFPNKWLLDSMLACSLDAGRVYFRKGVENGNFHVLKNAIELEKYEYNPAVRDLYRNEFHIEENEFVVGHIGRFSPQKNHIFISGIIKECSKEKRKYRFVLIGDGPLKGEIEELLRTNGIADQVLLLGNREDASKIYNMMDAFILPSIFEGLGIVAIEAQANGLPCYLSKEIPDEAVVLPTTKKISIHDGEENWKKELLMTDKIRTKHPMELLTKYGYSIPKEARNLHNIYVDLLS